MEYDQYCCGELVFYGEFCDWSLWQYGFDYQFFGSGW